MKTTAKTFEKWFRHVIVYPFLRLVFRNPIRNDQVDLRTVRKILILRADGIGDMIVSTPMFSILKKCHPALHLAVFASPKNEEIIRHNPNVDKIYVLHKNCGTLLREVMAARREGYDVIFNFVFNRTTLEGILANIIAPAGLKIGQGQEKYRFYFNRMLSINHAVPHMVEVLAGMLKEVFDIEVWQVDLRYEIIVDEESQKRVDDFLREHSLRRREENGGMSDYMVLNFAAVDEIRRMSPRQAIEIIRIIRTSSGETPIVISPPNARNTLSQIMEAAKSSSPLAYPREGAASLLEIASLIQGARYVITPDTSIIHFASAMKTPLFALYTPTAARNHQWMPWGVYYEAVRAIEGQSVSSIEFGEIEAGVKKFLSTLESYEISPKT